MDCSDTTQVVQVSLGRYFFKKKLSSPHECWVLFHPPINQGKLVRLRMYALQKTPRKKKERFGCGMQFSEGRSRTFLLKGSWWLSRTHIPNQTWLLPTNAARRWGYAKRHPQSILQLKQATSKIWFLYSFEGFLLYMRDIVKITKVTNIN